MGKWLDGNLIFFDTLIILPIPSRREILHVTHTLPPTPPLNRRIPHNWVLQKMMIIDQRRDRREIRTIAAATLIIYNLDPHDSSADWIERWGKSFCAVWARHKVKRGCVQQIPRVSEVVKKVANTYNVGWKGGWKWWGDGPGWGSGTQKARWDRASGPVHGPGGARTQLRRGTRGGRNSVWEIFWLQKEIQ